MKFLECGSCNACCSGGLSGSAGGLPFGGGNPCKFLCRGSCSIYMFRPPVCKKYQCAWSQGLFTEEMKPTISNLLISVEVDGLGKQFLKVIKLNCDIKKETLEYLDNWVKQNGTYYILIGENNEIKPRIWLKKG